jgi:hypothetical protein
MAKRVITTDGEELRVQPKPALGVKIVIGIACGALALVALAIWALVKAVAP